MAAWITDVSLSDPRLQGRELAAFAAAVETGSMHGAAEALNLTQSAATKRIAALEGRTGAPLLERSRQGVTPTELGRLLYPEAKAVLEALAAAERVLIQRAEVSSPLRLAASHTIGDCLLPGWLAAFRGTLRSPISVQLDVRNSPSVLRALRAGEVEIGFVEGTDPLGDVEALPLVADEIIAVVVPDHPWARAGTVPVRRLTEETFLTREEGSGTRAVTESALADAGVVLEPALELSSIQSLKRSVVEGGFTLLSRLAVQTEVASGTLAAVSVDGADLRRDLYTVRVARRPLAQPARRFWAFLRGRKAASASPS